MWLHKNGMKAEITSYTLYGVIFMSFIKNQKRKIRSIIRVELCRIDLKCVIIGAVIILLCGFLSAFVGCPADGFGTFFRCLERPRFTPPAFLFPIIWTLLYILIGAAAGAVACARERSLEADKFKGLLFFILMMVFNFVWTPLFFGAGAFFAAFCAIIMMLILSFFAACFFFRIFVLSGAAMVIYILWLLFAAYLNLGVIILN